MAPSWIQILIVVVLLVLLFGRGKISELMGDVAKGIKSFKTGMREDVDSDTKDDPKTIEHSRSKEATGSTSKSKTAKVDT